MHVTMAMVALADAVASSSLKLGYIFVCIRFLAFITVAVITYGINTLINAGKGCAGIGLSAADHHPIAQPDQQDQRESG